MKIYVVFKDVDDYLENGGGTFPEAVFLNRENAERYAAKIQNEWNADPENYKECLHAWFVDEWETKD